MGYYTLTYYKLDKEIKHSIIVQYGENSFNEKDNTFYINDVKYKWPDVNNVFGKNGFDYNQITKSTHLVKC